MSDMSRAAEDFHKRIQQYVRDAEAHMNVPTGTISGTLNDSDFLFVVKMCAVIEPLLREVVREHVKRSVERGNFAKEPVSGTLLEVVGALHHDRLRKIVEELGVIGEARSKFIHALFEVRHRYAHHISNAHLTVSEVCDKIAAETGDKKLLDKLTGARPTALLTPALVRFSMFYNVALFLQIAVHMAKPPPSPSGGLLGELIDDLIGGSLERRDDTPKSE
jgi:hypothetical protein